MAQAQLPEDGAKAASGDLDAAFRQLVSEHHALDEQLRHLSAQPFLSSEERHAHVIVHGHTIYAKPELRENRIGIDTGAFRTGVLTALVLEGGQRRTIQAAEADGRIEILNGENYA